MRRGARCIMGSWGIVWMLLLLAGCSSGTKESPGEAPVGIPKIGVTECFNCHADAKNPAGFPVIFGDSDSAQLAGVGWLNGPHGNDESLDPDTHQTLDLWPDNTGFPYYGYEGLGTSPTCTTACHDPLGEGEQLEDFALSTGVEALGRKNRPIIGCESCHGNGGNHFGIGPLPFPRPDPDRCAQCHNASFPDGHLPFHPEGDRIAEDYRASPHARSINEHTYVEGSPGTVRARCARCHTDEGVQRYLAVVSGTATHDEIVTAMEGKSDIQEATAVQCRTCHDPHNPLTLLGAQATDLPDSWSDEFKTCTSCHQLLRADGILLTEGYHDPTMNPFASEEEIIVDTHYDDPETGEIEGYVIDPTSTHSSHAANTNRGTCRDCHNPHNADTTINRQWAQSGHGGHIATVKAEQGRTGAVTEAEAAAWVHYDFKGADRQACQRCHTATGFRNFANDPAAYDPANNVFVATGQQKELLYCWACHTSNVGDLRNPGPFSQTAPYTVPADRIAAVPDLQGSNLCMACHSGRESGQEIQDRRFPEEIVGNHFGRFNSHYLPAGGILFRTIGYEYAGRDYENVSFFRHDQIGSDAAPGTGTNGPCVGCHMRTAESHTFLPVKKDTEGRIVEITAQEVCATCHTGEHEITPEELNELEEGYEAALEALETQLAAQGIYYNIAAYPYFYTTPNPEEQNFGTTFTDWPNKETLGAAFNLNLLRHMPGAYIHNRFYTKRLLYDSLDFLDDGVLNASVEETLGAGPAYEFLQGTRSAE